jgi:hypothetical protein
LPEISANTVKGTLMRTRDLTVSSGANGIGRRAGVPTIQLDFNLHFENQPDLRVE